jgi:hypothetical protein
MASCVEVKRGVFRACPGGWGQGGRRRNDARAPQMVFETTTSVEGTLTRSSSYLPPYRVPADGDPRDVVTGNASSWTGASVERRRRLHLPRTLVRPAMVLHPHPGASEAGRATLPGSSATGRSSGQSSWTSTAASSRPVGNLPDARGADDPTSSGTRTPAAGSSAPPSGSTWPSSTSPGLSRRARPASCSRGSSGSERPPHPTARWRSGRHDQARRLDFYAAMTTPSRRSSRSWLLPVVHPLLRHP